MIVKPLAIDLKEAEAFLTTEGHSALLEESTLRNLVDRATINGLWPRGIFELSLRPIC